MVDYLTWYFRPKNSYEPERVDYNALNILAEYQTYNFEFLRNELDLNYDQCANVLQARHALQQPIFVALDSKDHRGRSITYYAQLILCFKATFLSRHLQLCYVRWLHTACDVACAAGRQPWAL